MLELELYNELDFFRITNSAFFIKSPTSFLLHISSNNSSTFLSNSLSSSSSALRINHRRKHVVDSEIRRRFSDFLSVSLSVKDADDGFSGDSSQSLGQNGDRNSEFIRVSELLEETKEEEVKVRSSGAFNTTKHLWAGAVAAMVSRTFVAPLERLKLEYIVRHEQKNLFELIQTIATTQGIKGFWKGNFVNILRTAPFKAINFYAYDRYRNYLCKLSGNEEAANFERFVAGAAAGITATLLCLPMDTIRTVMVAPGGEALGGVIGTCRHMIQTEGFFSLYKGLVPSLVAMAPSGAVFYGVYDILKASYLHSPEGKKRIENMKQQVGDLNALDQLELGPVKTLLYGAIAGACSEAATYPFEVVRRQLQLQVREKKLNAVATCVKIVEQGGVPALYAGLIPSLLQVLPSAAISYFVYEFMKVVLKVDS
ncbi:probable mitochondrial adenine nucleotide transporter BTL3 [Chenopodium quinoa]|uniref:Mitochondrial adenine nucleotide transporter BTL3 n=1 Tax=Chenopodium quinoa TaxID=63459 RepID=A0A803KSJ6_CHEQI|nr:probable mitochondrial adenine nucleotide transporter BTL3 [Chenopodium quinoa]